jgi:hypothetical protein
MNLRLGPICGNHKPGHLWLRLWVGGPGFMAKDTRRHRLLYSQRRPGVGRSIGWLWLRWLR